MEDLSSISCQMKISSFILIGKRLLASLSFVLHTFYFLIIDICCLYYIMIYVTKLATNLLLLFKLLFTANFFYKAYARIIKPYLFKMWIKICLICRKGYLIFEG